MSAVLRVLPVDWTSAIGAHLGRRAGRRAIKEARSWVKRLHKNLECLFGIKDVGEREAFILEYASHKGRVFAEFSILQRIAREGRIEVIGGDNLRNTSKPVIFATCHLGNWELIGHVLTGLPNRSCVLYAPQENPVRRHLVSKARRGWSPDGEFVAATPGAVFQLNRALAAGSNLLVLVDEIKDGHVMAPSLGRTTPYSGNRWLAARLALRHQVDIIPIYVVRVGNTHFRVIIEPKLQHGSGDDKSSARDLADQLDQRLEEWIRARPEQWFLLHYLDLDKKFPPGRSG